MPQNTNNSEGYGKSTCEAKKGQSKGVVPAAHLLRRSWYIRQRLSWDIAAEHSWEPNIQSFKRYENWKNNNFLRNSTAKKVHAAYRTRRNESQMFMCSLRFEADNNISKSVLWRVFHFFIHNSLWNCTLFHKTQSHVNVPLDIYSRAQCGYRLKRRSFYAIPQICILLIKREVVKLRIE